MNLKRTSSAESVIVKESQCAPHPQLNSTLRLLYYTDDKPQLQIYDKKEE